MNRVRHKYIIYAAISALLCITYVPYTYAQTTDNEPLLDKEERGKLIQEPQTRVTIPGLNFTKVNDTKNLVSTKIGADGVTRTYLNSPFLGEYLAAIYRYAVVAIGIVSFIMFIYAGIQMITSAGSPEKIKNSQGQMGRSVAGLMLAVGSYVLLYNLNPELVRFRSLSVPYIAGEELPNYAHVSAESYQTVTGKTLDLSSAGRSKVVVLAMAKAVEHDLPPCLAATIVRNESGGNPAIIGHDEDYPQENPVPARYEFLKSGIRFNGSAFKTPLGLPATYSEFKKLDPAERKKFNSTAAYNDDGKSGEHKFIDLGKPPNYGIDWRFTHGFGLGQITFGGNSYCDKSKGIRGIQMKSLGKCLTIPELLTVEGGVESLVGILKYWYIRAANKNGYTGQSKNPPEEIIRWTFAMYGAGYGGGDIYRPSINKRVKNYNDCSAAPQKTETAENAPVKIEEAPVVE